MFVANAIISYEKYNYGSLVHLFNTLSYPFNFNVGMKKREYKYFRYLMTLMLHF